MNEPTRPQPAWGAPPAQPARAHRSAGAVLAVIVLAFVGAFVGMFAPTFLWAVATGAESPFGGAGLLGGFVAGLAAGIWFGLAVTRRR
jgi:hypothetical protein